MENLKAYIDSGILELYVLGDLSSEEMLQVEEMASAHSEIRDEIAAIEFAMEEYAMQNAIKPSSEVEKRLFDQLGVQDEVMHQNDSNTLTAAATEAKIVKLDSNNNKIKNLSFALAACIALLIVSSVALFITYNKLNEAHDLLASANLDKQKFANVVHKLTYENKGLDNMVAMIDSKEWATVKMAGQAYSPKSKMNVYWNKKDKSVLINYVAMDLPKPDKNHQYQLWALVNGKPVSLGVFGNTDSAQKDALVLMPKVEVAQAFAVTLEPMGGSENPTMDKLTVMGGV